MTLAEWHEKKRLWDAEVAAGLKKGPFTIPRPKKEIGGPSIGVFAKNKGGKISKYYKAGGEVSKAYKACGANIITGR